MKNNERKSWDGLIKTILGDCLSAQTLNDLLAKCMLASIKNCAKARTDRVAAKRESAALYRDWTESVNEKNGIAARWEFFLTVLSKGGFSGAELSRLRADVAHLAFEAHMRGERIASPRIRQREFERWTQTPAARRAAAA
jgi:hypothetical protein